MRGAAGGSRAAAAIAVVAAVAPVVCTSAAGAVPCRLVEDPARDDAVIGHDRGLATFGGLDIVSADIATDRKNVTVVVRLSDVRDPEPGSPTGVEHRFSARFNNRKMTFAAQRLPEGDRFTVYVTGTARTDVGPGLGYVGDAAGVFDEAAEEVRMTAPLRMVGGIEWRRTVFDRFEVISYRQVGTANKSFPATASSSADMAKSNREYVAGTRTCVTVGA